MKSRARLFLTNKKMKLPFLPSLFGVTFSKLIQQIQKTKLLCVSNLVKNGNTKQDDHEKNHFPSQKKRTAGKYENRIL